MHYEHFNLLLCITLEKSILFFYNNQIDVIESDMYYSKQCLKRSNERAGFL